MLNLLRSLTKFHLTLITTQKITNRILNTLYLILLITSIIFILETTQTFKRGYSERIFQEYEKIAHILKKTQRKIKHHLQPKNILPIPPLQVPEKKFKKIYGAFY